MYIVTYKGPFGFIKPWTAVRDSETYSQQFLTPSIIEGIEKKLFPEMLVKNGTIEKIMRHKLQYTSMSVQQEVIQARGWEKKKDGYIRNRSILNRGVLLNPLLTLAFSSKEDAVKASAQHICLCRNEDVLLPIQEIQEMNEEEFNKLKGFELRFVESDDTFLVGYNRFKGGQPMYGTLEIDGQSILNV